MPDEERMDQSEEIVNAEGCKYRRICKCDGDGEADGALLRLLEVLGRTSEVLLVEMQAARLV